jgi:hypothetical protein
MKRQSHHFLQVDERIQFGTKKGSSVERYFDKSKFTFNGNTFFLYINHAVPPVPKDLIVSLIYLDENSEEYTINKKYSLQERQPGQAGKIEKKISVDIEKDGKKLQRIKFEHLANTDSSIYIRISDL